jgi:hypothetical protein
MKFVALLGIALALGACASEPIESSIPPTAKTIAIVSELPSQIRIATSGMTAFENALDVVDVPEWNLPAAADDAAKVALSPRYQIVQATVDGEVADNNSKLDRAFVGESSLEDQIRSRIHPAVPVDLYLIIAAGDREHVQARLPNIGLGIGVDKVRNPFHTDPPVVHTYAEIVLADATSGKVITIQPLRIPPTPRGLLGITYDAPIDLLDGFQWHDHWGEMSATQHQLIQDRLTHLLQRAVTYTVQQMIPRA